MIESKKQLKCIAAILLLAYIPMILASPSKLWTHRTNLKIEQTATALAQPTNTAKSGLPEKDDHEDDSCLVGDSKDLAMSCT